jgi:phenylpyruvate tautomerase PptA (4-oxalocrotonate tautomerase family)
MVSSLPCSAMPLAAALSDNPKISEIILYQLNGLIVVFLALASIWGLMELTGLYFRRVTTEPSGKKPESSESTAVVEAAPKPSASAAADPNPDEVVAVITAAVHVTLGEHARVASIVLNDGATQAWGIEGRRAIHSSRRAR